MGFSQYLQTFAGRPVRSFDFRAKRSGGKSWVYRVGDREYLRFVESQFNTGDELNKSLPHQAFRDQLYFCWFSQLAVKALVLPSFSAWPWAGDGRPNFLRVS